MSGRIVNLRTRRKQKARAERRKQPAVVAPGVSRLDRALAESENRRARERLDGHRLEEGATDDPAPDEG